MIDEKKDEDILDKILSMRDSEEEDEAFLLGHKTKVDEKMLVADNEEDSGSDDDGSKETGENYGKVKNPTKKKRKDVEVHPDFRPESKIYVFVALIIF